MKRAILFVLAALAIGALQTSAQVAKVAARTNAVPAGMVRIAGGSFEPLYAVPGHSTVKVAPFAIDTVPVSQAQYAGFVAKRAGVPAPRADAHRPATNVTWLEATAYCRARNARLATTDEWEYVARADEQRRDASITTTFRQRALQLAIGNRPGQLLIGRGLRNVWGVRDLHGGVSEWTADFNGSAHAHNRSAHTPAMTCASGTVETGDPGDYAAFLRYSLRRTWNVNSSASNLGFRCAL